VSAAARKIPGSGSAACQTAQLPCRGKRPRSKVDIARGRLTAIGLAAAAAPAALVYAGGETLALTTVVGVTPFALAVWLRAGSPRMAGGRTLRRVATVLLASLLVLFAEYWLLDREHRVDQSQLLGLGVAGIAGMGVAVAGAAAGGWMTRRTGDAEWPMAAPGSAAGAAIEDRCVECPQCGRCFAYGTALCDEDGAALLSLNVPHVLINRYRLERRLGRGGMATVYSALDLTLNRRVAAKLVRDDLVGLPGAAERFQREAQAAAAFNHPNVVTVFDYGVSGTQAFLVMEQLTGATLRERLRVDEPMEPSRALAILRDVTAAVEAAHGQQLIHRDLKPENIFLVPHESRERAKVLDFGLAKLTTSDQAPRLGHTTGGAVFGTPLYMAPEQLRGENAHPSWDLWALAVIAFEMLAGAHPFSAMSLAVEAHPDVPAPDSPLLRLRPQCQQFFARALAIDRTRRPQSPALFLAELERSLDG
jgi:tRNA A-37 threonylcarbamoyl transferase component Bud32